ncbi:MAG: tRNA 5-methoxyuridine(34)/uridine 5-oxyacetic acid(34) synthase CmoB [Gammaproteobacteria bacterium]|nr:tRNA 5-methoxyuridine(34)/uridine 5-oxyacetic acid(34) synthase CmoB [Gammaproteobacteria bacterium]
MTHYQALFDYLISAQQQPWAQQLQQIIETNLADNAHGKMHQWQQALTALPVVTASHIDLKSQVEIGKADDLTAEQHAHFLQQLIHFHPWRKGPYRLFGIDIDTEWRSDWKWQRLLPHIQPLAGRRVLDVGGGNGYHGWRMQGEDAELVIGIDPTLVFVMQYQLMQRYIQSDKHFVIPTGIESLPENLAFFDTVFSMGVLYHRRSPVDHLYDLRACLRSGGELVLETLVIDGDLGDTLMPENRYAKMRNVWFLPSIPTMILWLQRCGFNDVRCVDVDITSLDEQRRTEWMTFESLADFLDPNDTTKTIEGYPAPKRAIFLATAP